MILGFDARPVAAAAHNAFLAGSEHRSIRPRLVAACAGGPILLDHAL